MRYYYGNTIKEFLLEDENKIFGSLSKAHGHDLEQLQKNSWIEQIRILKEQTVSIPEGHIFFEFSIPRMGKRVDAIIILKEIVFVIEFKVGEGEYPKHAIDQVIDYAVDLKNFHAGSHDVKIVPILVSTKAPPRIHEFQIFDDQVFAVLLCNKSNFIKVISDLTSQYPDGALDAKTWAESNYKPTPTIVQAAQALYNGHSVTEISRSDAGAKNLSLTSQTIIEIIESSKSENKKSICFITGVPGSGKTLAGLHIATETQRFEEEKHAVFLSGNGPLVSVLREALARDRVSREKVTKKEAKREASTFIKNVHHFRDEALESEERMHEKVVIFDEAQRAWNRQKTSYFMKTNKGNPEFDLSEPEFLIGVMDRHKDWAVIICLIGGGQEINDGEAGLLEWFEALANSFKNWQIYISPNITDSEYMDVGRFSKIVDSNKLNYRDTLHLSTSIRSFRSEHLSNFVKNLLDLKIEVAKGLLGQLKNNYPLFVTRDLSTAKKWLNSKKRGSERTGLVASSSAIRLKPFAINVKDKIEAENYFLNDEDDIRSSYFLEDVATEFDIQGLELDWVCVAWDANLSLIGNEWLYREFRGSKWNNINSDKNKLYLKNAYRVLLTRARQGMVIFVPKGDPVDRTRKPEYYDSIFNYLTQLGIEILSPES